MEKENNTLLTAKQAAKIVGISPCRLRVYIREGKIKAEMIGTEYLIKPESLEGIKRERKRATYDE